MAEEIKKTTETEEETTEEEETEEEKKKKIFWARFGTFISTGFVAPITYLITRYNLFSPSNSATIGLWGCVVFIILIALVSTLVWYYLEAMKHKFSIWKQVISGVVKIILPLVACALLLQCLKDNIDLMIESLWVIAGCEAAAIPINPLPQWCFEHEIEATGDIAKQIYEKIKGTSNTSEGEK